jgi:hypothetical protein
MIDYHFEELQRLRFVVYDVDSESGSLDKHDFLGDLRCTLAEVMTSGTGFSSKLGDPHTKGTHCGTILISAETVTNAIAMEFTYSLFITFLPHPPPLSL